jgi:hypothetical protein
MSASSPQNPGFEEKAGGVYLFFQPDFFLKAGFLKVTHIFPRQPLLLKTPALKKKPGCIFILPTRLFPESRVFENHSYFPTPASSTQNPVFAENVGVRFMREAL